MATGRMTRNSSQVRHGMLPARDCYFVAFAALLDSQQLWCGMSTVRTRRRSSPICSGSFFGYALGTGLLRVLIARTRISPGTRAR